MILANGYVIARLFSFILNVASLLATHIFHNFAEKILEVFLGARKVG
jgi:hypothetical protein